MNKQTNKCEIPRSSQLSQASFFLISLHITHITNSKALHLGPQ